MGCGCGGKGGSQRPRMTHAAAYLSPFLRPRAPTNTARPRIKQASTVRLAQGKKRVGVLVLLIDRRRPPPAGAQARTGRERERGGARRKPRPEAESSEPRQQRRSSAVRPAMAAKTTVSLTGLLAAATWACLCAVAASAFDVPTVAFDERFSPMFGDGNLVRSSDDRSVRLLLDRRSGSGFISSDYYLHGFFSASIKLPKDYTAGVVVAFYLSNGDVYEKTHDELDFEFLGSRWGGQWRVQTNVYGNGSTSHGREERYLLPFDPTLEAHSYSVLWAPTHIIFYIDDTPIREVIRHPDMGGDFPAKPMAVYATIWDGSTWATDGGKYKVNYKYAPFASELSELAVVGTRADPVLRVPRRDHDHQDLLGLMTADYAVMTPQKRAAMRAFRARQMTYTVCYDAVRYADGPFPECDNSDDERESFSAWGESKTVVMRPRARGRRRGRKAGAGARARAGVSSS